MLRFRFTSFKVKRASTCFFSIISNVNTPSVLYSAHRCSQFDVPKSKMATLAVTGKELFLWPVTCARAQQLTIERFCRTSSSGESNWRVVYEGPLSRAVKRVKIFSLTTASASMIGCPILVFFGKQSVPLVGKLAIAGLLGIVGMATTLFLHAFTRTYVHKAYFNPKEQKFALETFSLFARLKRSEFSAHDVIIPEVGKMFSTFEACGRRYFIHEELIEAQQILQFVRDYQQDKETFSSNQNN